MNLKTGVELSGRFALLRRVGKNPSANVWLAVDGKRDAKVLVCVLHKHIAGDEGRREALYEAVSRMAEFDHPSILKIHESRLQDSGYDYYVKEFAEGESMHDAVLEGRLGRGKVIPVILAIGDALHYAHLRGMVHRDVNPGNILIDADMVPRLTSFSLGRADGSDSIATEIATDVYSLAMT
ncbi:MAG: protein kinase, partial [Myxococcales bacterium]|nr:protein kinase [Myxococcales bacterium]